jgi:hypothetical protein
VLYPRATRERVAQTGWVLLHLDDLASDFSAIHRVPDITALSGRAFLRLAHRLTAYQGVMRERFTALMREQEGPPQVPQYGAPQQRPGVTEIPATKAALMSHPDMAGIFSFGSGSGG